MAIPLQELRPDPWPGNQDSTSYVAWQKRERKKKRKEEKKKKGNRIRRRKKSRTITKNKNKIRKVKTILEKIKL